MRASDTLSTDEAQALAHEAAQKAKQQAAQETELKMRQPIQQALNNLEGVLDELSKFRRELFKEAESEILELVRRVCRRVVANELKADPEKLKSVVERAIEIVEREKFVKVIVSPHDIQMFLKTKPDFDKKFSGRSEIEIRAASDVAPGTALIQTETRQVEANVESMVDEILGRVQEQISEVKETGDEGDKV